MKKKKIHNIYNIYEHNLWQIYFIQETHINCNMNCPTIGNLPKKIPKYCKKFQKYGIPAPQNTKPTHYSVFTRINVTFSIYFISATKILHIHIFSSVLSYWRRKKFEVMEDYMFIYLFFFSLSILRAYKFPVQGLASLFYEG